MKPEFIVAITIYIYFVWVQSYIVVWLGNVQELMPALRNIFPRSIDDSPGIAQFLSIPLVIAFNMIFVLIFGIQHSTMARNSIKRVTTKVFGSGLERSAFVFVSSLLLHVMMSFWGSLPTVVWSLPHPFDKLALGCYFFGWAFAIMASFVTDHYYFLGLKQAWVGRHVKPSLTHSALYNYVRHPIYFGTLFAYFSAPVMTLGRLLWCGSLTAYLLIGVRFEEQELINQFGESYIKYKERTPMLIPWFPSAPKEKIK